MTVAAWSDAVCCKNCGGRWEQHNAFAQAIGAQRIYVWELGISLPVVDCQNFEPKKPGFTEPFIPKPETAL